MTRVKVFLFLFWAWITFVAIYIILFMSSRRVIEVSVMSSCVSFLCVFFSLWLSWLCRCLVLPCIVSCCTWRSGKDTRNLVPCNFHNLHILLQVDSMLSFFFPFVLFMFILHILFVSLSWWSWLCIVLPFMLLHVA